MMTSLFGRLRRDEDGFSLVTALAIAFTFMLLLQVLITHALHAGQQTGRDRTRTQAFHVAEAGVERAMAELSQNPNFTGSTETVHAAGVAVGTFTTTVAPVAGAPDDRLITSVATTGSAQPEQRTIVTSVTLVPLGDFQFALFSASTITLSQHFTLTGSTFADASIVLQDHADVLGDVISPGNITTGNNSTINGMVWSGGDVAIANSTTVTGNVMATGTVTVYGHVVGDVRAGQIIVSGGTIGGQQVSGVNIPKPLNRTLPAFTYNPLDYTPAPAEYASAALFTTYWNNNRTAMSGNYHVEDYAGGTITGPNQRTTLTGDLTIITNRPISISRDFISDTGVTRRVVLISTYAGPGDSVTWTNNVTMPPNVEVFVYTNGTVRFANQKNFHGIVYAQQIIQDQYFTIDYEPDVLQAVKGFTWSLASAGQYEMTPGVWRECNNADGTC